MKRRRFRNLILLEGGLSIIHQLHYPAKVEMLQFIIQLMELTLINIHKNIRSQYL